MFDSVLIANRGEIAVRIARTLRSLGIRSAAVYTPADVHARHRLEADAAIPIASYLDVEEVVAAAVASGSQALHPGYGFLSENPVLARACRSANVTFVGPPPEAIEMMGDKINAKRVVAAAGVPVVPGTSDTGLSDDAIATAAAEIGFPILLKPSAGGGGKGMRKVDHADGLEQAVAASRREALGAFGDDTLLVERLIQRPRHIEVQILADESGTLCSLGERECSLQRRHQKIVEETPSPGIDRDTRASMEVSAIAAAKSCGYVGAGTVEFIVPGDDPSTYYFMEMNTRLQVEHPVTEMVTGIDLVEWQLRIASGESLPWNVSGPARKGHAVEARVYAEDPTRGFLPSTGRVLHLREPIDHEHVRVDSSLIQGALVGVEYDPMLAKVVAWADDRPTALARLAGALAYTEILGVTTNVGFLSRLVQDPAVVAGDINTALVEEVAPALANGGDSLEKVASAAGVVLAIESHPTDPTVDPWQSADGWRLGGPRSVSSRWRIRGHEIDTYTDRSASADPGYMWARDGDVLWLGRGGDAWVAEQIIETIEATAEFGIEGGGPVRSPMPGTVQAVHVSEGDSVHTGQPLVVVEAMKMEHVVLAPGDGTVSEVAVSTGSQVALDQPLVVISP